MAIGDRLAQRIEAAESLDRICERLAPLLRRLVPPGPVEDVLSGTPFGHPLHPALVAVPIGSMTSVHVLDAIDADARTTRAVQAVAVLSALPAAASGASDWLSTAGAERRVGLVHAALNYAALALHGASWWRRGRDDRVTAQALALAGTALVGMAGWLGGHLAYALGVGVDTTAFQQLPQDWTDALALDDVPETGLGHVDVDGIALLVTRVHGELRAYSDRCTHRGAPLHEGARVDDNVVCPWHDSEFRLADGSVASGPATCPQPRLETRVRDGRVEVRRVENRSLRINPTGH